MKLSLTLKKENTQASKKEIYCEIKLEFKFHQILKWNCFIKISHYLRTIKDLIRIGKSKELKETLRYIECPSEIPTEEKRGNYEKSWGKITF